MLVIKIQSASDLITNSSSEVFIIYTREAIQDFKDIISTLIGENFDDVFNLEILYNEWAEEEYAADSDKDGLSFEDWCFKHDEQSYEGSPYVVGFNITAKDPKDEVKALELNRIYYLFESETRFC